MEKSECLKCGLISFWFSYTLYPSYCSHANIYQERIDAFLDGIDSEMEKNTWKEITINIESIDVF